MPMKTKISFKMLSLVTTLTAVILLSINLNFLMDYPQLFGMMNLIIGIIALGVPMIFKYSQMYNIKKVENMFPRFLMDVTENINAGMTLLQSIKATRKINYGKLNKYIKEMDAKLDWGINFDTVLNDFSEKIGSSTLKRTVKTIIETHRSGGTIGTVLEAVAESVQELEKIKKERSERVYSQMINGYIIFFIFLGVMFGLSNFLVPAFQTASVPGAGMGNFEQLADIYDELFRNLIIIQGVFAGLAIGKMAEGTFIGGFKHSLILVSVGYTVFVLFG